jgi:hypothetical protein
LSAATDSRHVTRRGQARQDSISSAKAASWLTVEGV